MLAEIHGVPRLMAVLLYGADLRLLECARLRVMDCDIACYQIVVRAGKGDKDPLTVPPVAMMCATTMTTQALLFGRDGLPTRDGWS